MRARCLWGQLTQGEILCAPFQKIKAVYDTNPAKFRTLQNILEVEKEMYGAEWPKVGATLALMWLKRGLRFIQVFLQSICDGERDENHPNLIRVNATKAYEMALKKYHGWIVQKIFQVSHAHQPQRTTQVLLPALPLLGQGLLACEAAFAPLGSGRAPPFIWVRLVY
ncbi:hypothetical protein P7K49_020236 [Saguinus oedipus]|uniref:Glycolipid transfer protein n=1 Tax=Saguinus oedipus TaxID=9490 RepID=A0ABQ9UZN3_SAGOE|nr:hypothetical protein P7K49_020236 [Saguinus oedipus]